MRILANNLKKLARMIILWRTVEQGFSIALNGRQRSSQFVRNVRNEIAPSFLDTLSLGQITQNGNRPSAWHRSRGHIESVRRNNRSRSRRNHLTGHAGSPHRTQEIRVANPLNDGNIQPRTLWNQAVHPLISPLHTLVGADCDDGVLHAIE